MLATLKTLAVGALGGGFAALCDVPAPWLLGATLAVAIYRARGGPVHFPPLLEQAMLVILGVIIASGVTPETLSAAGRWPVSMAGLVLVMAAMVSASVAFLRAVGGWDRNTAVLASIPGVLPYVLANAIERRADVGAVSFTQGLRVLAIVAGLPFLAHHPDLALSTLPHEISLPVLAALLGLGVVGAGLFAWLKVPSGLMLGALAAGTLAYGSGAVSGAMPDWLIVPAMGLLGCWTGLSFTSMPVRTLGMIVVLAAASLIIMLGVTALGSLAVASIADLPFAQVFLGFAPGGVEMASLMALLAGVDPAYVAAHQLMRFILIVLCLPLLLRSRPNPARE